MQGRVSEVVKQYPDWLILDRDGKPARITRNTNKECGTVEGPPGKLNVDFTECLLLQAISESARD